MAAKTDAAAPAAAIPLVVKDVNQRQLPKKVAPKAAFLKTAQAAKASVKADSAEWVTINCQKTPRKWRMRSQDWDSEVVLCFDTLAETIQTKGESLRGVVLVPNGEQKIVVENMLAGNGHKHALLMIVPGRDCSVLTYAAPGCTARSRSPCGEQ